MRYTDVDGNTHGAGEEVQRQQAESTGTDVGAWTVSPPEPEAEPAAYYEPAQAQQEPVYNEPGYEDASEYEDTGAQLYEQPLAPPNPFESEDFAADMEAYLDQRDQQQFGQANYGEQEAWLEQQEQQREAQDELAALDAEREFQHALPGRIADVLGNRPGAQGAGEMLAPAVAALGEQTANELLTGLVAEGLSEQQALETLSEIYPQLLASSVQQARQAYGTQQAFAEAKAMFFPRSRR